MLMKRSLTLADVFDFLANEPSLSATRRRDARSSLRAICKVLERDLAQIPADIPALRRALNEVHPAQHGLSKKRWQNIRSELIFAIRLILASDDIPKRRAALSDEWQAQCDQLINKRFKNGLSAVIRYCSAQDISPHQVSDATSSDFLNYLIESTLKKNPWDAHRRACRLWNEAARNVPGWPSQTLAVPDYRKPSYTLPWDQFPQSLIDDIKAHLDWLSGKDLLAEHQPPNICKASTIGLREKQIHILASSATLQDIASHEIKSLADLTSQPVAKAAIEYHLDRNNNIPTQYIRDLFKASYSIAKHWVRATNKELSWYRDILKRLKTDAPGLTTKNRNMLRQFESIDNKKRLLNLPQQLIKQLKKHRMSPQRQAVQFQLALAIEILLVAPMRIGNLASLRLDQHTRRIDRQTVHLVVPEGEVKNAVPLEYPLPDNTRIMLDVYLKEHRDLLTSSESPYLFPGKHGHKTPMTLAQQLKEIIERETGLIMTAHQFRHLAAKLYLDVNPGGYELVRRVLGHKSIKTTTKFYSGMETQAAVKHFDETILKVRNSSDNINGDSAR